LTLKEILIIGARAIGSHEAKFLLSHITGYSQIDLIIKSNQPLDKQAKGAFFAALNRRIAKEPLQYILGEWEFMGLKMKTDKRALIPRPETELLVEEALVHINKLNRPANVLDVCTGSGCIAVAIAKLTEASVTAIDISKDALELATENASLHGLNKKIYFLHSDLLQNHKHQTYDIIISNPPYVTKAELANIQPELYSEPILALDGGNDGMDLYRRLIPQSMQYLVSGGILLLEIGPFAVEAIMREAGYDIVQLIKDYSGLARVLVGQKTGGSNA